MRASRIAIFYSDFCSPPQDWQPPKTRIYTWKKAYSAKKADNRKEAYNWFRKAADKGLADAQFELGRIFANRLSMLLIEGVYPDPTEAARWYRKAAEQGPCQVHNLNSVHYIAMVGAYRKMNSKL